MKKLLLSLFVCVLGFVSFGYCGIVLYQYNYSTPAGNHEFDLPDGYDYFCLTPNESGCYLEYNAGILPEGGNSTLRFLGTGSFLGACSSSYIYFYSRYPCNLRISLFSSDEYTSQQCQTEYNLIPVEAVDINYCVENQLCPNNSGTGDFSGDLQFSNIYINDILHPGKQNIFVNIPDYIMWDYNVVGDDFNIYVGSGYDVDYINSVIDINSYRPTSSDFTNVFVGGLTLIFPYIVIVLFIVFLRKLIKRIFK